MNVHHTTVEQYKGFEIVHNLATTTNTDHYNIKGSAIAVTTVKAAKRVIDTYIKSKNNERTTDKIKRM